MTPQHFWHPDLSGTLQGAGGVGGLVAVSIDGDYYCPGYDNNGNVIGYWNEDGEIVAEYAYDAFGNTIYEDGDMADVFPHRFSTMCYDAETDLYYYGYRYYSPSLGRWISRDPIEEEGGGNVYLGCNNQHLFTIDSLGAFVVVDYSRTYSPADLVKMVLELDSRFPAIVSGIREPFKSAIQANWNKMEFRLTRDRYACSDKEEKMQGKRSMGLVHEKGQVLRDVDVSRRKVGHSVPIFRKYWTRVAILCVCNIPNYQILAEVAVHETAHAVGWGGPYRDDNDPRWDNLEPVIIHPHPEHWNIPNHGD